MSEPHSAQPAPARLYGLVLAMTLLWALNYIIAKVAVRELPTLFVAGFRTAIAGLIILPLYIWQQRVNPTHIPRAALPRLFGLALIGVSLNQVFFVLGIGRTSVAHASILVGLAPIQVLLLASLRGLERVTPRKIVGLVIALSGIVVLQFIPGRGGHATLLGDFLVYLSTLFFALFTVFGKATAARFGTITLNTVAYVGGGIVLLPITIWEGTHTPLSAVGWQAWASVLYMAVFPSVVCYVIYYYALAHLPASRVASFSYLQPIFAIFFAVFLLNEVVTLPVLAGGTLVLSGVILAGRS